MSKPDLVPSCQVDFSLKKTQSERQNSDHPVGSTLISSSIVFGNWALTSTHPQAPGAYLYILLIFYLLPQEQKVYESGLGSVLFLVYPHKVWQVEGTQSRFIAEMIETQIPKARSLINDSRQLSWKSEGQ